MILLIKPKRLKRGDTVAIVSLSWGGLGDKNFIHKFEIAKARIESIFGLKVKVMPHALKGSDFIANHPEKRALDLMDAFRDPAVDAIFSAIGGDDTIRILPYIDFDVISQNPKIFMGYSDTTANHFMIYKAGVVSFYGPAIMSEFGEYVSMFDYTVNTIQNMLFNESKGLEIKPSQFWTKDYVEWKEENINVGKKLIPDNNGYEVLQGEGIVRGHLLGGCLDAFLMYNGTKIWPELDKWENAILFLETSEDKPSPDSVKWMLRNLAAQGILKSINGILMAKPYMGEFYDEYKEALLQVVSVEEKLTSLPIFYNINFGHSQPVGVLPIGVMAEINCEMKKITILENATIL